MSDADRLRAGVVAWNAWRIAHAEIRAALRGADLRGAALRGADLRGADLSGACLRGADLSGADLRGAAGLPPAPMIDHIDRQILAAVQADDCAMPMSRWHTCEKQHCRAGWAIALAGKAGRALEDTLGSCAAGALIYAASRPDKPVPEFYASDGDALADLARCADEVTS